MFRCFSKSPSHGCHLCIFHCRERKLYWSHEYRHDWFKMLDFTIQTSPRSLSHPVEKEYICSSALLWDELWISWSCCWNLLWPTHIQTKLLTNRKSIGILELVFSFRLNVYLSLMERIDIPGKRDCMGTLRWDILNIYFTLTLLLE